MSKKFAIVFPGQGSQSVGMLGDLAAERPLVRATFAEASAALGMDLWQLVSEGPKELLDRTDLTQPAMLAAGVAVWRVWTDAGGPDPAWMAGHSLGEFTALVCAGAMDFIDAVTLVAQRGQFMQEAVPAGAGAMAAVLAELDASGLAGRTIVVFTSDHGDMDGAHQLHAKGAVAYREQNNVPLVVVHPAHAGGRQCRAVTSHLDLAPTLLALAQAAPEKKAALARKLPGKDFSGLLAQPQRAAPDAVRDGMLFCYNMFAYLDGEFLEKGVAHLHKGGNPKELAASGVRPDMMKRGAVRSVFDGRYTFSRYHSNKQHNRPTTIEELYRLNDVELFDAKADPHEMTNLAQGDRHRDLVLAMNEKLNRLIDAEVGEDRGQMLPGGIEAGWEVTPETMAGA